MSRMPSTSCSRPLRTKSILPPVFMEPETSTEMARLSGGRMLGSATRFELRPSCSMVQLEPFERLLITAIMDCRQTRRPQLGGGSLVWCSAKKPAASKSLVSGTRLAGQQAAEVAEVLGAAQADVGVAGGGGGEAAGVGGAAGRARQAGGSRRSRREPPEPPAGATGPEVPGGGALGWCCRRRGRRRRPRRCRDDRGRRSPGRRRNWGRRRRSCRHRNCSQQTPGLSPPGRGSRIAASSISWVGLPSRRSRERGPVTQLACHPKPPQPPSNHPVPSPHPRQTDPDRVVPLR